MAPNSLMSHPEDEITRSERSRPAFRPPQSASTMNLEELVPRPKSPPLNTYVAVARGTAAGGNLRERRGSDRDRSDPRLNFAQGEAQPRADTPAPVPSRDARLDTTAVHLRLALPHLSLIHN